MIPRPTPAQALLSVLNRNAQERASILAEHNQPRQNEQPQHQRATFYDHVVRTFFNDDEEEMLNTLAFGRVFFQSVLNIVDSVPLPRQGRPGFVRSHKDKLLFLVVFLKDGTNALNKLCLPAITDPSSIMRNLHQTTALFRDVLLRNTVEFKRERCDDIPTVSCVIDCTVVEIRGPTCLSNRKTSSTRASTNDIV